MHFFLRNYQATNTECLYNLRSYTVFKLRPEVMSQLFPVSCKLRFNQRIEPWLDFKVRLCGWQPPFSRTHFHSHLVDKLCLNFLLQHTGKYFHSTKRLQFQRGTFRPPGLGAWGRGWAHSIAHLWVPISSPLTHMVYLLPFLSYLAGSKRVAARPSDPDTMTNTTLESIASSSGKNETQWCVVCCFVVGVHHKVNESYNSITVWHRITKLLIF